jgi:hypothetical protein
MLEIKQLTRLQIIKYCEKLEKENAELKEHKENLILLDKKKDKEIEKLEQENKKLKEEIDTSDSVLSSYIRQYKRIKSQIYAINDVKNIALKKVEKLEEENKKLKADTEHTIKFNNKIIGKLKLENDKLKVIIKNNDLEQKADWKHIEELEEENKKIKADYIKLSKIVETT